MLGVRLVITTTAITMAIKQWQALVITRLYDIEDVEFFKAYGDEPQATYDEEEIWDWAKANKATPGD